MFTISSSGAVKTIRGDDICLPMRYTEDDGTTGIDLTDFTIRSEVRTKPNGFVAINFQVLQVDPRDGTVYDLSDGEFMLYAPKSVMELLKKTDYEWDIEFTAPSGTVDTEVGPSTFKVVK